MARSKKAKMTRYASLSLATPKEDGEGYDYDNFGAIIGNEEFPGTGSLILEVDHPERVTEGRDGKQYPVRGRLVAAKFVFPGEEDDDECEEIVVEDLDECFINATFWEAVEAKPQKKKSSKGGVKRRSTRSSQKSRHADEDEGDED